MKYIWLCECFDRPCRNEDNVRKFADSGWFLNLRTAAFSRTPKQSLSTSEAIRVFSGEPLFGRVRPSITMSFEVQKASCFNLGMKKEREAVRGWRQVWASASNSDEITNHVIAYAAKI